MVQSPTRETSSAAAVKVALVEDSFRHEALFYSGDDGFLQGTLPFVTEALAASEPVLVAVGEQRAELLRHALGEATERVRFLDMHELGRNPARLIPAWQEFLSEHAAEGRSVRGIGEPTWPDRSDAELDECERHEALLNVAFEHGQPWRLLCPYDLDALSPATIDAARTTHPVLMHEGVSARNGSYRPLHRSISPFDGSLSNPPAEHEELAFTVGGLSAVRALVARCGSEAGLGEMAREDFVLAVNELATNSVQHGGGGGMLRVWQEPGALVCDVRDRGFIEDPLAGRRRPPIDQYGGRGLWLVNRLCDLVQIRSSPSGTVVRVHMRSDARV
jgi:anti-sigma regulatory factor (Ser/Thr protein kinase)